MSRHPAAAKCSASASVDTVSGPAAPPAAMRANVQRLGGLQMRPKRDTQRVAARAHSRRIPFQPVRIEQQARRLQSLENPSFAHRTSSSSGCNVSAIKNGRARSATNGNPARLCQKTGMPDTRRAGNVGGRTRDEQCPGRIGAEPVERRAIGLGSRLVIAGFLGRHDDRKGNADPLGRASSERRLSSW